MAINGYEQIKDLYEEKKSFSRRVLVAGGICVLMIIILLLRLADLQVRQYAYFTTRADDNRKREVPSPPARGLIYDRNGVVLADNKPSFNLEIIREQVEDMDALLARLTPQLGLTAADIARFKDRIRKTPRYRGVVLKANLSAEEMANFELNRYAFKGAEIAGGLTRLYPLGATASHLVGYVGGISEADYKNLNESDYKGITQIGKMGVEKSHENSLRGVPGARVVEADASGRPLRTLEEKPGIAGRNLYMSLDAKLQQVAEKALGDLEGAVVAIDPTTGELLALVSKPGFDPQLFVEGISTKNYRSLQADPERPLYNRALQGTYPPGSTIKPFMSFAGFMTDEINDNSRAYCDGSMSLPRSSRQFRCHKRSGHGTVNPETALAKSCDIFYYQLALGLGIDRIEDLLGQFGFGRATGLDIPNERNGLLPSRSWKRRVRKEEWYPGETLNIGIGQGYWLVTPLQLAQATARLAMRGGGFKPHLLRATEDTVTRTVTAVLPEPLPPMGNRDPHTYDTVISAMVAVTSPGGTAARIGAKAPYAIAGKTGTSQVAGLAQGESAPDLKDTPKHLRDHAWFMGFAPAESPRIAVAVLAEHAGHGGAIAAPIARQVMDQYLLGKVLFATEALPATADTPAPTSDPAAALPTANTSGMSPADAIDATNPEEGFLAPPAVVPSSGEAAVAAPAANPPQPQVPPAPALAPRPRPRP